MSCTKYVKFMLYKNIYQGHYEYIIIIIIIVINIIITIILLLHLFFLIIVTIVSNFNMSLFVQWREER